jgi:hypothetical protein
LKRATRKSQSNNQRKNNLVEIDGVVKTLSEWFDGSDTKQYRNAKDRINILGWCKSCAVLAYPLQKRPKNCNHNKQ